LRFKFLCILFLIPVSLACSSSEHLQVKGMDMTTAEEDQHRIIEWEGIISFGNLRLPESNLPILGPDRIELGELTFQQLDDGTNRISIRLDQSQALENFQLKTPVLPNGSAISLNGSPLIPSIEIPLLQNSRLYVGTDSEGSTLTGIALNLPAFDRILSKFNHSSVVESVDFEFSNITGSVGIYGSGSSGSNGVFLFAQKSNSQISFESDRSPASLEKAFSRIFKKPVISYSKPSSNLNLVSQFRLNYLLSRNATLRIK
jgi:hypothetical protein